jgi:DNA-binding MarR family transcriptional regulator
MRRIADDDAAVEHDLVAALSALSRAVVAITARTLVALDTELTLSQYRVMVMLASQGPQRSVDLAVELGIHPSTASRNFARLVHRGLLCRHHVPHDRRITRLALSDQGKQLIGEVMHRRSAEIQRWLSTTDVTARTPARRMLDRLVTASGELPEEQWWARWARSAAVTE